MVYPLYLIPEVSARPCERVVGIEYPLCTVTVLVPKWGDFPLPSGRALLARRTNEPYYHGRIEKVVRYCQYLQGRYSCVMQARESHV